MYKSFLAPIDGYSDAAFRLLCSRYGAEASCVPLINADAVLVGREAGIHPEEKNLGVQLVGNNPETIGKACRRIVDGNPEIKWLNLNCGCPSSRTRSCGGGSALLDNPEKIVRSVAEMKKCGIPVSIKIRITDDTMELCRKTGADFLIVHGRTPGQGYSGKNNWEIIKRIKQESEIPVIGNGDITMAWEGKNYVKKGYCDSFMAGRAAMSNPLLFSDRKITDPQDMLDEYMEIGGVVPGLKDIRLKAMHFISGFKGAPAMRNIISRAKTIKEIREAIKII
ncbi:tRNA-dihydrouridine synthase family protein [Candidatus Micrarchaeota archaeon]|nr:tRNA-dihydrouridine synthase family protein [Candidatus Micrarchaeota archaeon]